MKWHDSLLGAVAAALLLAPRTAIAQPTSTFPWTYTLTGESSLTDDCPVCDRVAIVAPLRGTFELRLLEQGPLFSTYSMEHISLHGGNANGASYSVTGKGTYRIGGEVATVQDAFLEVEIGNGATTNLCYLTNSVARPVRNWPMLRMDAIQTNGTLTQQYSLEIAAAPFREIWFSTAKGFISQPANGGSNWVSSGDIVSTAGRVVKQNFELVGKLGFMPVVPDLGVKDFDLLPGGEIAFSLEQAQFSETLGPLTTGDLLTDHGRVLKSWSSLLAAFSPDPLPVPPGLQAVTVRDSGEILFSVENGFFSKKLGNTLNSTDLLSDSGSVVEPGSQLLSAFGLKDPSLDCGLTAVFIWPSPFLETWFFTGKDFQDTNSNSYAAGDLLSDRGYVVFRAAELLSALSPAEATNGLPSDGLFVVTDASAATATGVTRMNEPVFTNDPPSSLSLSWTSSNRLFQLEKATDAAGPYDAATPIGTSEDYTDPGAATNPASFYRLRTW
jgi:hypothetical protein